MNYSIDEKLLDQIEKEVITIRRDLHQIPEIGFAVAKTADYIERKLNSYGYQVDSIIENGLVASKEGSSAQEAVAFRADMDGLEIVEETGVDFVSKENFETLLLAN